MLLTNADRREIASPMNTEALRDLSILLIEDDEVDVMNVRRALRKNELDIPVSHAKNGLEGLSMLRQHRQTINPSGTRLLILLDLNMPRMGGIEFLQELRGDLNLRNTPVVVLTTSKEENDRLMAYRLNVAGYIVKPVDFPSFVETIKVLSQYWSISEMP
jgi:CheY-like chemotaxis protein